MKVSDVQIVLQLARQGIKVVADNVEASQGAQAFAAIAEVENWVSTLVQKHQEDQPQAEQTDENGQGVEVVEVSNEEVAGAETEG